MFSPTADRIHLSFLRIHFILGKQRKTNFFSFFILGLYKSKDICYNPNCSTKQHMALWCSRLARQPVTLEVDGSSPFGVAKKRNPSLRDGFLFCYQGEQTRKPALSNSPVDCCNRRGFAAAKRVRSGSILRSQQSESVCKYAKSSEENRSLRSFWIYMLPFELTEGLHP